MNHHIGCEPKKDEHPATCMSDTKNVKMQDTHPALLLRPSLFWDVNLNKLDMDQHAAFIIVRVMERGTREEVQSVWNYYGEAIIKKHLLAARYLSNKTISYFANKFDVSRTQFKSYHNRQKVSTWP